MTERPQRVALPGWLVGLLAVVAVGAYAALFALDDRVSFPPQSPLAWVLFILVGVPAYIVLEGVAEAACEGLVGDARVVVRAIPFVLVVAMYVVWIATR